MSASRKLLLVSGLALALWGMGFGLWYALFAEHQALDGMGAALTTAFSRAAQRKLPEAHAALESYARTKFDYERYVDAHSHWTGLAMLLIIFGAVFHRVGFRERARVGLAVALVLGSVTFPLGVILQTVNRGAGPKALAILGAALVIAALGLIAVGLARREEGA